MLTFYFIKQEVDSEPKITTKQVESPSIGIFPFTSFNIPPSTPPSSLSIIQTHTPTNNTTNNTINTPTNTINTIQNPVESTQNKVDMNKYAKIYQIFVLETVFIHILLAKITSFGMAHLHTHSHLTHLLTHTFTKIITPYTLTQTHTHHSHIIHTHYSHTFYLGLGLRLRFNLSLNLNLNIANYIHCFHSFEQCVSSETQCS
jgi:hypothetical protein